jgi:iron(III) transport system ATP-binding protein
LNLSKRTGGAVPAPLSSEGTHAADATSGESLVLESVTKRFGDNLVVDRLSLRAEPREALVLLGPSGCGKTTTLRLIAGFERTDGGSIRLGSRMLADRATFVPPEARRIAVVFQSYALWPHMTVAENVGFGPRLRAKPREVKLKVTEALRGVHLEGYAGRYPHELSGGQQQRVALARALVVRPEVLLLDEPLSNLDSQLREDMRRLIKRLHEETGETMVYVTHDQTEALALADRIIVMRAGRIEQIGTPTEIYERPRNQYVAEALGPTNLIHAAVDAVRADAVELTLWSRLRTSIPRSGQGSLGRSAVVSIRPGAIELTERRNDSRLHGEVQEVVYLGDVVHYRVLADSTDTLRVTAHGRPRFRVGDPVEVVIRDEGATVLDTEPVPDSDHGGPADA